MEEFWTFSAQDAWVGDVALYTLASLAHYVSILKQAKMDYLMGKLWTMTRTVL